MMYHQKEFPISMHGELLDNYLSKGWFRFRETIFTTSHLINHEQNDLNRVWWLRYKLEEIVERKSHSSIIKKNHSFRYSISDFIEANQTHIDLFKRYTGSIKFETYDDINEAIYGDGDHNPFNTKIIEVFDNEDLIAVGIFDVGKESAQSILHFYDPLYAKQSLGKYLLLITIKFLKENNYTHYYPGYIVCNRPEFDYKLCLGEDIAQYYNPETEGWHVYNASILNDQKYTEDEVIDFFSLSFSFKRVMPRMFYQIDRHDQIKGGLLDYYLEDGWFRMQSSIYRNSHILDFENNAVFKVWRLKYVISEINLHASHKRIWKLIRGFKIVFEDKCIVTQEDNELYSRYIGSVNFEGYTSIAQAISDDGLIDVFDTHCVRIYHDDCLIAMGIFDKGRVSVASILNFYDPSYSKYSLGKFIILLIIEKMKEWRLSNYYPGYIVAGKPKFDYKLFLGKESAYYLNREQDWVKFEDSILKTETSTSRKFYDFLRLITRTENISLNDEFH